MRYTPPRDARTLGTVSLLLLILGTVALFVGGRVPYGLFLQAAGWLLLIAFLFLTLRYALSEFTYAIEDESLVVYRRQGRRTEAVCSIALCSALALLTEEQYQERKRAHALRYNYCQNLRSPKRAYFLFVFDDREDKRALLIFEPCDEMREVLLRHVPSTFDKN